MTHEELADVYELYALGILEAEEKAELEQHLARNCSQCQAGIRQAIAMNAFMGTLPDVVEPPKRLRRRVLASVGVESGGSRLWLGGLAFVSACLVAGMVVLGMESVKRDEELASVRAQLRQSVTDSSKLQAAFQFLNEPETQQVVFGKGQPLPPRGRIFVNGKQGVLLMASNLPAAPTGKIYEMWLLPKQGVPLPAGLFQSDGRGNALYIRNVPFDPSAMKAVAVTLEPESGSQAPTSTPMIVAGLSE